jgi:hypothetical protein
VTSRRRLAALELLLRERSHSSGMIGGPGGAKSYRAVVEREDSSLRIAPVILAATTLPGIEILAAVLVTSLAAVNQTGLHSRMH